MYNQEGPAPTTLRSFGLFSNRDTLSTATLTRPLPQQQSIPRSLPQQQSISRLLPQQQSIYRDRQLSSLKVPGLFNLPVKDPFGTPRTDPLPVPRTSALLVPRTDALPVPRTDALPVPNFANSARSQSTESLSGLHKHWMSSRQQSIYMTVVFFAVGFSAITALATAIIGLLPLDIAAYVLIWPSVVVWLVLGILYPRYGKLALKGFVIGMVSCFFYDCMRFIAIELHLWNDFIPRIAMLLLHTNKPDWVIGYIWRYIGDGGFMSTTFVMGYYLLKPKLDVRIAALAFGITIWFCLIATILLAPDGAVTMFPLTPIILFLSLLGHVIYGLSIGLLYTIFIKKAPIALRRTNPNRGNQFRVA